MCRFARSSTWARVMFKWARRQRMTGAERHGSRAGADVYRPGTCGHSNKRIGRLAVVGELAGAGELAGHRETCAGSHETDESNSSSP